jgi:hypothetical protein
MLPWWLGHCFLKRKSGTVYKVYIPNSLADVTILQNRYPNDFVALPTNCEWYTASDVKHLNYDRLCAQAIHTHPFIAMRVIENTPCKHVLFADRLLEFQENNDIVSHECKVRYQLL